jgi:hypothetical protein
VVGIGRGVSDMTWNECTGGGRWASAEGEDVQGPRVCVSVLCAVT